MKVLNWFKKYFIPHKHNDHKPHILRLKGTFLMLAIIFFIEAIFLVQIFVLFPNVKFFAEILVSALVQDTNANRLADNLSDLKINPLLMQAAQAKADDMAVNSYFAHTSPSSVTPWYWFQKAGYEYIYAGENLAINFSDSEDVVNAWMNSAGHRANILNGYFTEIGIGIAKGIYQKKETVFIVQMFGRPAGVLASASSKQVAVKTLQPALNLTDQTQMFIAVKNASEPEVLPTETNSVKADTGQNLSIYNLVVKFVASPDARTKNLYFIILGIISLALILNILVKIKVQHPHIIMNGIVLILIINAVLIINQYLTTISGKIF